MRVQIRGAFALLLLLSFFLPSQAWAGLTVSVTLASGQPGLIYPGEETQLEIVLSNNNTSAPITGVAFSSTLPGTLPNGLKISSGVTYTCTDPAGPVTAPGIGTTTATVGTQTVALSGGVIPARANNTDGTCTIRIPVTAGSSNGTAQTYTYSLAGGAVTGNDGGAVSNTGLVSQSVNVRALILPTLSKTFGSSTLWLGGAATTLTVTVNNPNPIPLPNVSITDTFPQLGGLPLIKVANPANVTSTCTGGGTPATFSAAPDDSSITATGATVAASSSCSISVAVVANHTNGLYQTPFQNNTISGATDFSTDLGLVPANATAQVRTTSPLRACS